LHAKRILMENFLRLPVVPDDVEFHTDTMVNAQGLKLQTYHLYKKASSPLGIVWLCHGYASHFQFDWFLPLGPGKPHEIFEGGAVAGLLDAGYVVGSVDYQSHGRSEGIRGLRGYFEKFDDLPNDTLACVDKLRQDPRFASLPVFAFGVSMGGAVAVRMSQMCPDLFRGVVLYSPMLCLESIRKEKIVCCIKNGHLACLVPCLNACCPEMPLAKGAKTNLFPLHQKEFDEDPLTHKGDIRVRTGKGNVEICKWFMSGGLKKMSTPFVTFHAANDNYVDSAGSERLMKDASCADKEYVRVGAGLDLDINMWHSLNAEPGREIVFERALTWIKMRTDASF